MTYLGKNKKSFILQKDQGSPCLIFKIKDFKIKSFYIHSLIYHCMLTQIDMLIFVPASVTELLQRCAINLRS